MKELNTGVIGLGNRGSGFLKTGDLYSAPG